MSNGLDVIIVDDDPGVCKLISEIVMRFYVWGDVISIIDVDEAIEYCLNRERGFGMYSKVGFLGRES